MKISKYFVILTLILPAFIYWKWAERQAESAYGLVGVSAVSAAGKRPLPARELSFYNAGMKKKNLNEFKGKALLLNFWATWCPPCVEELPSLVRLAKKLNKNHKIKTVLVSVDENWGTVNKFFKKMHFKDAESGQKVTVLPFEQFLDPEGVGARGFGTEKFPETYLISSEGLVLKKFVGAQNWEDEDMEKWILDALH